ncbi:LamB/YcsF family protein [Arenivirga flava]|uniref:UPF0271 protein n=1 Tax=Arenivirga flava TaxID=1930060 RepID=A0AA37UAH7_9MICO|nr:5-oxoprolinase subunit PxpA [Arenivirga flava]GMA27213.1 UPF0271 protein [Arenivirga flava]
MTHRTIDLVADLGESFGDWSMGDDAALLEILSSANVACGFHAGDPRVMDRTVAECVRRGVAVGAHPAFPDLVGFGRRAMDLTGYEVRTDVVYQLGALRAVAAYHGAEVVHLAPHGRLGNLVATRQDYADAVVDAVRHVDPSLRILAQDGCLADAARADGIAVGIVGIVDRAYEDDGTLVPRSQPGAVLHDAGEIAERALRMVLEGVVISRAGTVVPVDCDSILLHGDSPEAVAVAQRIRAGFETNGIAIAAPGRRA